MKQARIKNHFYRWRLDLHERGRESDEEDPMRLRIWDRSLKKTCIILPLFWEPIDLASSLLSSRSLIKIGFLERIHDQPHSHHSFTELPACSPMADTDLDLGNRAAIAAGWFERLREREERRRRMRPGSSSTAAAEEEELGRWETGREVGLRIWRVSIIELIALLFVVLLLSSSGERYWRWMWMWEISEHSSNTAWVFIPF